MSLPYRLSPNRIIIAAALFLVATANLTFFRAVLALYPVADNMGFVVSIAILLTACLTLLMSAFSLVLPWRWTVSLFLLTAAGTSYFSDQFGTVIDLDMIRNVYETDAAESIDLFSSGLLFRVFFLGVAPVVLLWWLPTPATVFVREKVFHALTGLLAVGVMAICVFGFSSQYASFFREHKTVRYYISPAYPIYSAMQFAASFAPTSAPLPFMGLDAMANILETEDAHAELVILVVGETARADHFSLNGYQRNTNPRLSVEANLISFSNIHSCGTSTAISVPCMFSYSAHDGFDVKSARNTENGLDLLQKAGVNVLWRDNNSDSKGVADRVPFENFRSAALNPACDEECRDIGMLDGLQAYIDGKSGDILIVLHQMGSHGPAYHRRYPAEFEKFTPACQSNELADCTQDEIINAYDNTILYTDYFLSQVIALLKANSPKYEAAMFYVSDHGESLGESGIYLHGMPYSFAPEAQTHVPVIAWIGPSSDIDYAQSLALRDQANSHDVVFDTLLAVFEVTTELLPAAEVKLVVLEDEEDEKNHNVAR
ncbi:lipid A ethanolaminephosphotransferase [Zhongshania antarctica]|uniref:Lipid A ethanolaminephosphotransferase n=1 Tax=Zhongshania antarctica TaxID=641702 RepID=A0A840R4V0_9GAMM|nr:phosphoethanolamine--lipid A transferase [Zhongshania antarctica]MBB5187556.1 lipid A ethanolaminephosphotransferase [Zhongshania antarctica]